MKELPRIKPIPSIDEDNCILNTPSIEIISRNPDRARELYNDWASLCEDADGSTKFFINENHSDVQNFLSAVFELSPYLHSLSKQFPAVVCECHTNGFQKCFDDALEELDTESHVTGNEAELMSSLRRAKKQAALISGLADLGGWWSAARVSQAISKLADTAVELTVNHLIHHAIQSGKLQEIDSANLSIGSGYTVIAMGKHGAGELNYSSDIDLIVFFDPDAPAIIDREESVKLFVRMTKSLVRILQERTADGYVFRTDLRLRPDPGSMPLAIPLPVALNYYESRGQNWERAALIKARTIAGDCETGAEILNNLAQFIWRRYLDYAAIADVHAIKRQIQTHREYNDLKIAGHNVKLGRGGIREIEFFVQTQQLIAGGRNPELRTIKTVDSLKALVAADWLQPEPCDQLLSSYSFLRDVEHRLQMVADEQTHTLPENTEELEVISRLCGFPAVEHFSSALMSHLINVEGHYAALFAHDEGLSGDGGNLSFTGDDDDPGTLATLSGMGFADPSGIIKLVRSWHYGRYPAMASESAREQLTELTPELLESFSHSGRGDETIRAFDEFLQGLPSGYQLFSLLKANPKLLSLLTLVLSSAPRLARIITRRPHVFDGVLEPGFFNLLPDGAIWEESLQLTLSQAVDYEDGLDRARVLAAEQKFLIGMRLLSGAVNPQQVAELYTKFAEVILIGMVDWVAKAFEEQYGQVPGASFAVVGLGNLGTHELTANSDLDIMLVYEFSPEHDYSDGEKSLHASQYFGRFAQRLIAAMSAATAQGVIYELDFRLRPNGAAGPIATSLIALEKYYSENAWTWEELALTRARVLGKETPFTTKLTSVLTKAYANNSNHQKALKDVLEMRALMDRERPANGPWDIKLSKGGLVDLEFLAQAAVMVNKVQMARTTTDVLSSLDSVKLHNDDVTFAKQHSIFQGVVQVLRLCLEKNRPHHEGPPGMQELLLKQLEMPDWKSAEAYLRDAQRAVRKSFLTVLKQWSEKS